MRSRDNSNKIPSSSNTNSHSNHNINSKSSPSSSYSNHLRNTQHHTPITDDDNFGLNFSVFRDDLVSPNNDCNVSTVSSNDSNPDVSITDDLDYMHQDAKISRYKQYQDGIRRSNTNTMKQRRNCNNGVETRFTIKDYYYKKREKKDKKEIKQYRLAMREIGNNLKRIINEQIQINGQLNWTDIDIDGLKNKVVEGPLNDYTKLSRPKPVNLKMVRHTRTTTNTLQSYKRVKSVKHCNIGDQVILINNLKHRQHKYKQSSNTDILQVHGVVNQIHPDYITIIIPVNHHKQCIQRKIYAFDLRDDDYGAVYIV